MCCSRCRTRQRLGNLCEQGDRVELSQLDVKNLCEQGDRVELSQLDVKNLCEQGDRVELSQVDVKYLCEQGDRVELSQLDVKNLCEQGDRVELSQVDVKNLCEQGDRVELSQLDVLSLAAELFFNGWFSGHCLCGCVTHNCSKSRLQGKTSCFALAVSTPPYFSCSGGGDLACFSRSDRLGRTILGYPGPLRAVLG